MQISLPIYDFMRIKASVIGPKYRIDRDYEVGYRICQKAKYSSRCLLDILNSATNRYRPFSNYTIFECGEIARDCGATRGRTGIIAGG